MKSVYFSRQNQSGSIAFTKIKKVTCFQFLQAVTGHADAGVFPDAIQTSAVVQAGV